MDFYFQTNLGPVHEPIFQSNSQLELQSETLVNSKFDSCSSDNVWIIDFMFTLLCYGINMKLLTNSFVRLYIFKFSFSLDNRY